MFNQFLTKDRASSREANHALSFYINDFLACKINYFIQKEILEKLIPNL